MKTSKTNIEQKNKRLAVVISTFSSLIEDDMKKHKDIFLTPLQLFVGSNQWFEGDYSNKEKYEIVKMFKKSDDFKTSLGPVPMVEEQMKKLSKEYDAVIYMPINSYLSSSHDSIVNLSRKFSNVHVFNNKFVGWAYLNAANKAKQIFEEENGTIEDVFEFLKWYDQRTIGYIIPFEFKTFIKSGRLRGIKKVLMTSLNLSTIVEFDHILTSAGIARTQKAAAVKVMGKLEDFAKEWKMKMDEFQVTTIYAYDQKITDILTNQMKSTFNRGVDLSYEASLSTMFHTGWGAGYIGVNPIIDLYKKNK